LIHLLIDWLFMKPYLYEVTGNRRLKWNLTIPSQFSSKVANYSYRSPLPRSHYNLIKLFREKREQCVIDGVWCSYRLFWNQIMICRSPRHSSPANCFRSSLLRKVWPEKRSSIRVTWWRVKMVRFVVQRLCENAWLSAPSANYMLTIMSFIEIVCWLWYT